MTHSSWSTGTTATLARGAAGSPRSASRLRGAAVPVLAQVAELGCAARAEPPEGDALGARLDEAARWLGGALAGGRAPAPRGDLVALLESVTELRAELRAEEPRLRLKLIADVCDGLARLRAEDDPGQLLHRVPEEVCRSCGMDRAVVARVDAGRWTVEQAHFTDDPAAARSYVEPLRDRPRSIALEPLEADIIRRRAAVLVDGPMIGDPDLPAPLERYVAAPVVIGDRVTAIVYARPAARAACELDRDALRWFTEGVAGLWERAALALRLRAQRDHVRELASTARGVLGELHDSDIELRTWAGGDRQGATAVATRELRVDGLITRRELEVLELMAEGMSNAVIADRLVIAEGTVKSHVKHILRKLAAANRAEAVARYLHQDLGDHDDLPRT